MSIAQADVFVCFLYRTRCTKPWKTLMHLMHIHANKAMLFHVDDFNGNTLARCSRYRILFLWIEKNQCTGWHSCNTDSVAFLLQTMAIVMKEKKYIQAGSSDE